MDRVWKTISLTPYYEVSNDGKVRNKITGRIFEGSNIFSCLAGRLKTTGGYRFEEVSL